MSLNAHPVRRPFPPLFQRKAKLVRCWQPRGNASMNSRRGRVKLPTGSTGIPACALLLFLLRSAQPGVARSALLCIITKVAQESCVSRRKRVK
jgi:hypothetical protein